MFKVSELNPKDTTLDEIHKIQKKIFVQDKNLLKEEKVKKYILAREKLSKNNN